jgi:hypothetical protein
MYDVQKGIEIPKQERKTKLSKFIEGLAIGDSFEVPTYGRVCSLMKRAKAMGKKIDNRKQDDGTYRCWLVQPD